MDVSVSERTNPQHDFSTQLNQPQRYKLGKNAMEKKSFQK